MKGASRTTNDGLAGEVVSGSESRAISLLQADQHAQH